jgi:hypothetical protein
LRAPRRQLLHRLRHPFLLPAPGNEPQIEPLPLPSPLLKLHFNGPSWAEVKDAEGKVLHSQHNQGGSEYDEGTPPFYVVIGDANKATVEVRGEAYDLAPYTRQNVAGSRSTDTCR